MVNLLTRAAAIFWFLYTRLIIVAFTVAYLLTLILGGDWHIKIHWQSAIDLYHHLFN